jgi:hypothetical protein
VGKGRGKREEKQKDLGKNKTKRFRIRDRFLSTKLRRKQVRKNRRIYKKSMIIIARLK